MQSHPRPWWHEWVAKSDKNEKVKAKTDFTLRLYHLYVAEKA